MRRLARTRREEQDRVLRVDALQRVVPEDPLVHPQPTARGEREESPGQRRNARVVLADQSDVELQVVLVLGPEQLVVRIEERGRQGVRSLDQLALRNRTGDAIHAAFRQRLPGAQPDDRELSPDMRRDARVGTNAQDQEVLADAAEARHRRVVVGRA